MEEEEEGGNRRGRGVRGLSSARKEEGGLKWRGVSESNLDFVFASLLESTVFSSDVLTLRREIAESEFRKLARPR